MNSGGGERARKSFLDVDGGKPRLSEGLIPLYAFQKAALLELPHKLQVHHGSRIDIA